MSGLLADLRHAVRVYLATPLSSALVVIVLAVAMACVSSLLSLYSDLVLKAHPAFERSNELITIGPNNGTELMYMSQEALERIREDVTALSSITGLAIRLQELDPGGRGMLTEFVVRDFFATMRPRLQLGRAFDFSDHQADAEPVTIISHNYWVEHFGGREDAIGQSVRIGGTPFLPRGGGAEPRFVDFRIVGVMDESYQSTFQGRTSLWLPFELGAPIFMGPEQAIASINLLSSFARLDDATNRIALVNELNARYGDGTDQLGLEPGGRLDAMRGVARDVSVRREAERQVRVLLAGGLLLALAAASNVSLFLLSRAPGRRRELGIRMSVGAPLKRLARQLATEAGLLVLVSAVLGVLLGAWLNVLLQEISFLRDAPWRDVSIDWRVLSLVGGMTLLLTGLVSLGPVLGLKRLGIAASSRAVSARPGVTQHIAGNLQITAACILAGVAAAFGWYVGALITGERGFTTEELHLVSIAQPRTGIDFDNVDFDNLLAERERKRDVILALPGVDGVAFGTAVPGRTGFGANYSYEPPDGAGEPFDIVVISCGPRYTELLDMSIIGGRGLTELDRTGTVVNETFARKFWGRSDVVGEVIPAGFTESNQTEVVGVLADVSFRHPSAEVPAMAFVYMTPFSSRESILIRSPLTSSDLRLALQDVIDAGALEIEMSSVEWLSDIAGEVIADDTARGVLAISTALIVVVLACFGFYGTQRFLVTAGRREFAIRSALGAGPRAIQRLVVGRALRLGAPGLFLGVLLAFMVVAWMRDDYVTDMVSPAAVALFVLVAIAALLVGATLAPARMAGETDPGPLLKQE